MDFKALQFLKDPKVCSHIVEDFEQLGYVGEEDTKLLVYLISVSRKLRKPLAGMLVGCPSSGKSLLLQLNRELVPEEDMKHFTRLTEQSLFYLPESFSHQLLVIEETQGSVEARYSLRNLISETEISLLIKGEEKRVEGPIAYLEGSTAVEEGEDFPSRILIIPMDESEEQTRRVQEMMKARAAEPWLTQEEEGIALRHQQAQAMLQSVEIVIPYAKEITEFPTHKVSNRRDFEQFLGLIQTVCFLHQYQRDYRTIDGLTYMRANEQDYEIAYSLMTTLLKQELNGRPEDKLLKDIEQLVVKEKPEFTRRDIVNMAEWTEAQIKNLIPTLLEQGALERVRGGGRGFLNVYRLNKIPNQITPPEAIFGKGGEQGA